MRWWLFFFAEKILWSGLIKNLLKDLFQFFFFWYPSLDVYIFDKITTSYKNHRRKHHLFVKYKFGIWGLMIILFIVFTEFEKSDEQKYEFAAKNQKDYTDWLAIIKSSRYFQLFFFYMLETWHFGVVWEAVCSMLFLKMHCQHFVLATQNFHCKNNFFHSYEKLRQKLDKLRTEILQITGVVS